MKKLNVGYIGWLSVDESSEYTTVAWCNLGEQWKQESSAKHPDIAHYTDYQEMIKHPGLDAVVISTPNVLHAKQAIDFLNAGIHVFLEKPMGINKEESDAILQAAQKNGKTLVIDFELRISIFAQRLKQIIDDGEYGQLRRIEFLHHRGCWFNEGNGTWRVKPELSGGLYFMEPIHEVDLFRFLGGEIESVQSTAGPNVLPHYQFQDNVCSHFFFESGALGTILTSHTHSALLEKNANMQDLGHNMDLVITLSDGSIGVDLIKQKIVLNRFENYPAGTDALRVVHDHIEDYSNYDACKFQHDITKMRLEFLHRLANGLPPFIDALDAWQTHQVCLAAEKSIKEDFRRVKVAEITQELVCAQ